MRSDQTPLSEALPGQEEERYSLRSKKPCGNFFCLSPGKISLQSSVHSLDPLAQRFPGKCGPIQAAPYAEWEAPIHITRTNFLRAPWSHQLSMRLHTAHLLGLPLLTAGSRRTRDPTPLLGAGSYGRVRPSEVNCLFLILPTAAAVAICTPLPYAPHDPRCFPPMAHCIQFFPQLCCGHCCYPYFTGKKTEDQRINNWPKVTLLEVRDCGAKSSLSANLTATLFAASPRAWHGAWHSLTTC